MEICVSNAKVMGSILEPHIQKSIAWMQCKSLWIKSSAKCRNVVMLKGNDYGKGKLFKVV